MNTQGRKNAARRPAGARYAKNARRKGSPLALILIALATLAVIALAVLLPRACTGSDRTAPAMASAPTPTIPALSAGEPDAADTQAPGAANAGPSDAAGDSAPAATPVPGAETAAESQAAPTSETLGDDAYTQAEVVGVRPTVSPDGYLPIFSKAETSEKIIAITVDDCNQTENLRQIVQCAIDNGAKLTIFPIGKNLTREGLREVVRYAYENGMELENHSYSHEAFYRMEAQNMAAEIFNANRAVSSALGVNYQMHFMRTRGGDNRRDLRTHQYIEKLGYYGMAHWTMSGSSSSVATLKSSLEPGNIYLFHTTDNDLSKLLGFIPYAVQQGYRLVTLNEMFGYPENEVSEITTPLGELEVPEPDPYVYEYKLLNQKSTNNYVWDVCLLQRRLIELGWLSGEADGVYGHSTYMAVGYFQKAIGMQPDGDASPETQEALFADDAPRSNDGKTIAGAAQPASALPVATGPVHTTAPRDVGPQPTVDLTLFD